jgi:hypothetical protein
MSQDYVKVYDAVDAAEAELLREALADAGIKAYIDNIPSPLDGLLAMGQGIPVMVDGEQRGPAVRVIEQWAAGRGQAES